MELMDKAKMMQYKALLEKHMSDPVKLRLTTVATLLALSFALVYMPLSKEIEKNKKLLAAEKERNTCIAECEKLQKQAVLYRALMGEKTDTNDWVQYLLGGMEQFKIRLKGMESKQQKKVGPYKAVALSMEIEGSYPELRSYVEWLESSPKLLRIDTITFEKKKDTLAMKIVVVGILPNK